MRNRVELSREIAVVGMGKAEVSRETIGARAREQEEAILAEVLGREREEQIERRLRDFSRPYWEKLDEGERKAKVAGLTRGVAHAFGIRVPYAVKMLEREAGGGNLATVHTEWVPDDGSAKFKKLMPVFEAAGVRPAMRAVHEVTLAKKILEDGATAARAVAHEFWHVRQRQEIEMWLAGVKTEETGEIAGAYVENLRGYVEAGEDYGKYRDQLLEAEAFAMGARYYEAVKKAGQHKTLGQRILGAWK